MARITKRSLDGLGLSPGQFVYAQVKAVSIVSSRGIANPEGRATTIAQPVANTAQLSVGAVRATQGPEEPAVA